jgi:hypothetical protein
MAFQEWNARILLNSLLGVPQILAFGSKASLLDPSHE